MLEIDVPGYRKLSLQSLVLDYNGTLACDGQIIDGVKESLHELSEGLRIYIITADTFGKAHSQLKDIPCELTILPVGNQDTGKLDFVKHLGIENTVCIGNGRNDRLMLKESALGIAVVLYEGAACEAVHSADVVCSSILSALELLTNPLRLIATLRS
jgi:soluble P-type ATPase